MIPYRIVQNTHVWLKFIRDGIIRRQMLRETLHDRGSQSQQTPLRNHTHAESVIDRERTRAIVWVGLTSTRTVYIGGAAILLRMCVLLRFACVLLRAKKREVQVLREQNSGWGKNVRRARAKADC